VRLAKPSVRWLRAFVAAVRRSRGLHAAWVSPPATPAAYHAYLRRLRRASHAGYFIWMRGSGELVGVVRKRRTVRMVDRTRVHLDDVEGLGTFVG